MKIEKINNILRIVQDKVNVSVSNLEKELSIPRTTLLRYLNELERKGHIIKTFGEVRLRNSFEESFAINRKKTHIKEKESIAKIVSELINNGEVIFLDGGSTNLQIAKKLFDKEIVIYTNNLLLTKLVNKEYKPQIYFVPGAANRNTLTTASVETIKYIETIKFNKSFIGFNSFSEGKFATTNSEEAFIKKAIFKSTIDSNSYIVGGSYKINTQSSQYIFLDKKNVSLITEKGVN